MPAEACDGNALLMGSGGGGVTWAKFPNGAYGTTVVGEVLAPPEARQQINYVTGEPDFYDNGDKKMEVVVNVQTTEMDPTKETDDGVRAFHLKGRMLNAVRDAVREAGASGLERGGRLAVTYTGDVDTGRKGNPAKDYSAEYKPPAAPGNQALMRDEGKTTASASALDADTPPCPPGIDPSQWQNMTNDQRMIIGAAVAAQKAPAA